MWIRTPFVAISIYSGGDGAQGGISCRGWKRERGLGYMGVPLSPRLTYCVRFDPLVLIWSARSIETLVDGLLSLSMCLSIISCLTKGCSVLGSAAVGGSVQLTSAMTRTVGVLSLL